MERIVERIVESDVVADGDGPSGAVERPGLAELARLDPGDLARELELALPGMGVRPVALFNSGI